jgi:hypothetical protein
VSFCTQLTAVGIRSKKNNLFFPICSSKLQSIMLRLDNASRERTIGMLQLGATQGDVARRLDLRETPFGDCGTGIEPQIQLLIAQNLVDQE